MISKESSYIGSANYKEIVNINMFLGDYAYSFSEDEIGEGRLGCITKDDFYKGNFDKVIHFD